MAGDVGKPMKDLKNTVEGGENRWQLDQDGHLADPVTWSPAFAEAVALADDLSLSDDRWWLIEWVRHYWLSYGNAPLMRSVVVAYRDHRQDPSLGSASLYGLFADNPIREACRLGGVPKPDWCI